MKQMNWQSLDLVVFNDFAKSNIRQIISSASSLEVIDLSSNYLDDLHGALFQDFHPSLEMINISECNLTDISARSRIDELFPQLRAIDMRGNKLNTIERKFASWIAVDPSSRIFTSPRILLST